MNKKIIFLFLVCIILFEPSYQSTKANVSLTDTSNNLFVNSTDHKKISKISNGNSLSTKFYPSLFETLYDNSSSVNSIAFAYGYSILLSGNSAGEVKFWNISSSKLIYTLPTNSIKINVLAVNPSSTLFATGGLDGKLKVWNTLNLSLKYSFTTNGTVKTMVFSNTQSLLAVGTTNGEIELWNAITGLPYMKIPAQFGNVTGLAFSSTDSILYSSGIDGKINLWNVTDGSNINNFTSSSGLTSLFVNDYSGKLTTLNSKGIIETWNNTGFESSYNASLDVDTHLLTSNPFIKLLVTSDFNNIKLWEYAYANITGGSFHTLTGHTGQVIDVKFSPSGLFLASASSDKSIRLYLTRNDTDSDGIPDLFEITHRLNPLVNDALQDKDGDYMTNLFEYQHGLDPNNPTDGLQDLDNDGMTNSCEAKYNFDITNPADANQDADSDGIPNVYECQNSLNPRLDDASLDKDNDGMPNLWEYQMGLNVSLNDASLDHDEDGMPNLWEYQMGLNASFNDANLDHDHDGMPNLYEYQHGLNASVDDSMGDLDGDGMPNGWEYRYGLNPNNPNDANLDPDSDGLTNLQEYQTGRNPWFNEDIILYTEIIFSAAVAFFIISFFIETIYNKYKSKKIYNEIAKSKKS